MFRKLYTVGATMLHRQREHGRLRHVIRMAAGMGCIIGALSGATAAEIPHACLALIASVDRQAVQPVEAGNPQNAARSLAIANAAQSAATDVVLLGDSEVERWKNSYLFQDIGDMTYFNAGVNADIAPNALWRVKNGGLPPSDPQYVIVFVGTNRPPNQPANTLAASIAAVIQAVRSKYQNAKIIDIAPPPLPRNSNIAYLNDVSNALKQCDNGHDIAVVDTAAAFLDSAGKIRDRLTIDGLHMNRQGYAILGNAIKVSMKRMRQ